MTAKLNPKERRRCQSLVRDFEQRLQDTSPSSILKSDWFVAVVVHPTSDEIQLLERLGLNPSDCIAVDSYLMYDQCVYWVEVNTREYDDRGVGVHYRFNLMRKIDVFKVILDQIMISSLDLVAAFERIRGLVDSGEIDRLRSEGHDVLFLIPGTE